MSDCDCANDWTCHEHREFKMSHYLDRTDTQCQPCEHFVDGDDPFNVHECFAPFDGSPMCDGKVYFCQNCHSDHHSGGYNSCKAREPGTCPRNHPACA